jgi:deoxyribodipyrimidine photolyase-related protein
VRWARDKKQLRMESFYRVLRKQHGILMDGDKPVGGQWNYDAENRQVPKKGVTIPKPFSVSTDAVTEEILELVRETFPGHFGDLHPFYFAVTREQALAALTLFIDQRLTDFGRFQDAMLEGEPWMFHSHISFYLNVGLLLPQECVDVAVEAYQRGRAPLNAVEGFVRQILGWREFVRGIYWLKMPEYQHENYLNASRSMPDFFWTAETQMNCVKQCVTETKENAYAHHIQRLMVLGNFALLAGLDPDEVNNWYLLVYADAFQWVELPNVTGMILFADGGVLASKPYAASGAYINKMSNYCKGCVYSVKEKNSEQACPFNYLYWDFLARHKELLASNPRLSMIYRSLEKMSREKRSLIAADSARFFSRMENNEAV